MLIVKLNVSFFCWIEVNNFIEFQIPYLSLVLWDRREERTCNDEFKNSTDDFK